MACAVGHDLVHVGVNLRHDHLAQLTRQGGACFKRALGFVLVQLVHIEDERAVIRNEVDDFQENQSTYC